MCRSQDSRYVTTVSFTRGIARMIILDMEMPKNCKECGFRLNRTRQSWRCGLHKAYRGGAAYIAMGIYPDADKERPDFCPLDKGR